MWLNKPRWLLSPRLFKKISFLILTSLLLLIIVFPFFPYLEIIDGNSNKVLYKTPISTEEKFSIKFIHSIHLTPVEEIYYIDRNLNVVLTEVSFDTYSVGIPSELNENEILEFKDGRIIIKNMNRQFPFIDLRVGQVISNHTLTINNETLDLAEIASPGAPVRIKATRLSIFRIMEVSLF